MSKIKTVASPPREGEPVGTEGGGRGREGERERGVEKEGGREREGGREGRRKEERGREGGGRERDTHTHRTVERSPVSSKCGRQYVQCQSWLVQDRFRLLLSLGVTRRNRLAALHTLQVECGFRGRHPPGPLSLQVGYCHVLVLSR